MDKNADGRITEEEVKEVIELDKRINYNFSLYRHFNKHLICKQIISLSASANNLSNIQDQAEEYAALIMEELDPDNLGYIEVTFILRSNS